MSEPDAKQTIKHKGPIWMTIAIDPIKEEIVFVGITINKKDLAEHRKRTDLPYIESFDIQEVGYVDIYEWFVKCGIVPSIAMKRVKALRVEILRRFGTAAAQMRADRKRGRGGDNDAKD